MKRVIIKINDRVEKVLNFDDKDEKNNNHYIIRDCDDNFGSVLFSIKNNATLVTGYRVESVYINGIKKPKDDENSNVIEVELAKGTVRNYDAEEKGLEIEEGQYVYRATRPSETNNSPNKDTWEVHFKLDNSTVKVYLHYATKVYDAIIDFGSEASQACWIKGGVPHNVNITQGILDSKKAAIKLLSNASRGSSVESVGNEKLQTAQNAEDKGDAHVEAMESETADKEQTVSIEEGKEVADKTRESEKKANYATKNYSEEPAVEDFIQYESPTLYKSIYYIKKDLGNAGLDPWPDYNNGSIEFLVSNTDDVDSQNYLMLPNSKLALFDISKYSAMVVKSKGRRVELWELGDKIVERILLNNIVEQVLRSIQYDAETSGHDAYVVLNVLMPNVYPIHVTSQKLEQLAKDINASLSQWGRIKAVELRSVSESDASLVGYANTIVSGEDCLDSGNYLIMDAGKGTLDFSIMEISRTEGYVNKSRSGIIGAGNAITYGLVVGLVYDFLKKMLIENMADGEEKLQNSIKEFIFEKVLKEDDVAKLRKFNDAVEGYKKVYNVLYSAKTGEPNSGKAKSQSDGERTTQRAKESIDELSMDDFTRWVEQLSNEKKMLSNHGCNYVSYEIECIVEEAVKKLCGMFSCIERDKVISHVVFTGRGFLMKEFREKMKTGLCACAINENVHVVDKNAKFITLDDDQMKSACLNINQKLSTDKYDASPLRQTVGLLNVINDVDGQQVSPRLDRKKGDDGGRLDKPVHNILHQYYTNGAYSDGDIAGDGIEINGKITADSNVSIGGWLYSINSKFRGKICKIYFDGTNYWVTAARRAQILGGVNQQPLNKSPLCFESLFPNVNVETIVVDDVIIPQPSKLFIAIQEEMNQDADDDEENSYDYDAIDQHQDFADEEWSGGQEFEDDDQDDDLTAVDKIKSVLGYLNPFKKSKNKSK